MLETWHVPTWSGDYRLSAEAEDRSLLEIVKPTKTEIRILREFFKQAGEKGWHPTTHPRLTKNTDVVLEIAAGVVDAAPVLIQIAHAQKPVWTGLKSTDGKITLLDEVKDVKPTVEKAPAKVAASVPAPRTGCPAPDPCNVRASEVLAAFSSPAQIAEWSRSGSMRLVGNRSGRAYRLFHRNTAARLGLDHALIGDDGLTRCVWSMELPAEEEALAIKFMVEHREDKILKTLRPTRQLLSRVPVSRIPVVLPKA